MVKSVISNATVCRHFAASRGGATFAHADERAKRVEWIGVLAYVSLLMACFRDSRRAYLLFGTENASYST